jgi:hypothetical protein
MMAKEARPALSGTGAEATGGAVATDGHSSHTLNASTSDAASTQ